MQKVLIITYYWPPAGGPGVQRWLKFVKYLGDFAIEPLVYIPENPTYPIVDRSLLDEVPESVRILSHPIVEPYGWASLFSKKKARRMSSGIIQKDNKQSLLEKAMLWIRGNVFIPDARRFWVGPSTRFLAEIIEREKIKTMITTGPPHSLHLIGLALKNRFQLEWITDFRDPWTTIGYHKQLRLTKMAAQKHKQLEQEVLQRADKVVVTSRVTQKELGFLTNKPIKVITNGYDGKAATDDLDGKFTISHIGSMLTGRNPLVLWQVLHELILENEVFKAHFQLKLIGVVSEDIVTSLQEYRLSEFVQQLGYVDHHEVLEHQMRSQILLLVEIDALQTKGIIPGKLFEYMASSRPILAIGPEDWEAGTIVEETRSGKKFNHTDAEKLKTVLLAWFDAYQTGKLKVHPKGIERYSRKALTKELTNFIRWESS
ncbi:MAG: glycosyl transferase family 1 [Bacteroidota bacterium]